MLNFEEMDKYLEDKEINSLQNPPNRMDFCWIIPIYDMENDGLDIILGQFETKGYQPFRPIPLEEWLDVDKQWGGSGDLSAYHVAGLEHMPNAYRLYFYGEEAKGVFRGPNQQLVVESIPMDDEWKKFRGILIFDEPAYEKSVKDWKNYWTWRKERNEARYRSQEAGEIDYDAKNMMHCMRLLWSGKNILVNGEPIVRFSGENLRILKGIRNGEYTYDQLIDWCEQEMAEFDELSEKSSIPAEVNHKAIDRLYKELIHMDRGNATYES